MSTKKIETTVCDGCGGAEGREMKRESFLGGQVKGIKPCEICGKDYCEDCRSRNGIQVIKTGLAGELHYICSACRKGKSRPARAVAFLAERVEELEEAYKKVRNELYEQLDKKKNRWGRR